jgi:phage baseplate assembly protein W
MSKLFLGQGVGFPVSLNGSGKLQTAEYEESVRQSILIILGTAKGERLMRPDFGCGIYDLVFEINSASVAGKISQAVQEAILKFEPRVDVLDVKVTSGFLTNRDFEAAQNGSVLMIEIKYQVRTSNNVFNLVYPFYLERSAG